MNKQEGIKELESLKMMGNDTRAACYNKGINAGITIVGKLDEPQKPVVPQFVAEKMKLYKSAFEMLAAEYFDLSSEIDSDDLANWIDQNGEKFLRAWLDGYEVKKEPLYEVVFLEKDGDRKILIEQGGLYDVEWESDNEGYWRTSFTEQEIKVANKNYWPFAVPVEEVAEG